MDTTLAQQTTGKLASSNAAATVPMSGFAAFKFTSSSASNTNASQTPFGTPLITSPRSTGFTTTRPPMGTPPTPVKVESAQTLFQATPSSPTKSSNVGNTVNGTRKEEKSTETPARKTLGAFPHPEFTFEDGNITLQAGHMTFTIHRSRLIELSTAFKDMISLGPSGPTSEGTKECPVVLQLNAIDLERFLKVLYPRRFDELPFKTAPEWYSVLLVADMFDFVECGIRGLAIAQIEKTASCIEKIVWGEKFKIKSFLMQGYSEVCNRNESLTYHEIEHLDAETLSLIMKKREAVLYAYGRSNRRALVSEEDLAVHFKERLRHAL